MDRISYFEYASLTRVMPKILGICFLLISVLAASVVWPVLFVSYLTAGELPSDWLQYLLLPIVAFFAGGITLNMFPNIGVSEKGLYVQFFAARWIFVPWQDVVGLSISPITASSKTPVYVIQVRKLTIWHRIPGFFTGTGATPGIAFFSDMEGYERLIARVEAHIEKAHGEVQAE